MKLNETKFASTHEYRRMISVGTLIAAALVTGACSSKPAPKVQAAQPSQAVVKSASLQFATSNAALPKSIEAKSIDKTAVKQPGSKLRYKSRDYAVSFEYPWQYSFSSAKKISEDDTLQPKTDGHDGQITLARVDVPKGFYPDTDFESGYITLSLNQDVEEHDCKAMFDGGKNVAQVEKINDIDFLWVETESGGKGEASRVRNYAAFANDACYEIELGVKTKNENGLAKEVNADHVMGKLNEMLKTVKINGSEAKPVTTDLKSSVEQPKVEGQK